MRMSHLVLFAAVVALPPLLEAQAPDSLHVGDRVRVRVAATRGYSNLFIGNVASISPDTLVVDIPGNKGTIILPRAGIAEVAVASGRESRFVNLPHLLPLVAPGVLLAT